MNFKIFSSSSPVTEKNMATLNWAAYTFAIVVCLAFFPCGAFSGVEENSIIHSAEGVLSAFKSLQSSCRQGLTYSEYARALDDVKYELNKFDAYFTSYVEEASTREIELPCIYASTCRLLAYLHHAASFHEQVKGWWERQIQKHDDPDCLELMFSDEWDEITLLLEDASKYLEQMKESCRWNMNHFLDPM